MCRGYLKLSSSSSKQINLEVSQQKELAVVLNGIHTFLIKEGSIKGVKFFEKQFINCGLQVCFINQKFNVKAFDKIIKCLMGLQCHFERNQEVINLMKIIQYLDIPELEQLIENDLAEHFDDYGFFVIFEIAEHFNNCQLKLKCLKQLLSMEFEQINFSRYELFERPVQIFMYIIKMHNYFQEKQVLVGLQPSKIYQIIQQYCKFSSVVIQKQNLYQIDFSFKDRIYQVQNQYDKQFKEGWIRFKTPSFCMSQLSESISFGDRTPKDVSGRLQREDTIDTNGQLQNFSFSNCGNLDIQETLSDICLQQDEVFQRNIQQDFGNLHLYGVSQTHIQLDSQQQIRIRRLKALFEKQK